MTALLYAIDFVRDITGVASLENNKTELRFDKENLTTPEEILKTEMEDLLIMRVGEINPFFDQISTNLSDHDEIYLNNKAQLIRIIKKETDSGKIKEIHNIITFDVSKLEQAKCHNYVGNSDFES